MLLCIKGKYKFTKGNMRDFMKKKLFIMLPYIIMLIFIPIYEILDNLILVDIFGCGCVPIVQTNMLNIPFNANHLRMTVFSIITIVLSIWSIKISKTLSKKSLKCLYCFAVLIFNVILTLWGVKTFMWG